MRIGELAAQTGVNIETIRYYEREGILPKPARTANNYRRYSQRHRRRLRFVRRTRDLGFTLDEVRVLLSLVHRGDYTCAQVKVLGEQHLDDVRAKMADLQRMERALSGLVSRCSGEQTPDCSMLETLFDEGHQSASDA